MGIDLGAVSSVSALNSSVMGFRGILSNSTHLLSILTRYYANLVDDEGADHEYGFRFIWTKSRVKGSSWHLYGLGQYLWFYSNLCRRSLSN